jgi:hypothetical protein
MFWGIVGHDFTCMAFSSFGSLRGTKQSLPAYVSPFIAVTNVVESPSRDLPNGRQVAFPKKKIGTGCSSQKNKFCKDFSTPHF